MKDAAHVEMYVDWVSYDELEDGKPDGWYETFFGDTAIIEVFNEILERMLDARIPYPKRAKYYKVLAHLYTVCEEAQKDYEMPAYNFGMPFKERIIRRDAVILRACNDGINYDAPDEAGLYFVGETHFNPHTREEYYWVKIGESDNLRKRLRGYNSTNPMLWRIGYKLGAQNEEKIYHELLRNIAVAKGVRNDEWFLVNRETYLAMCEKGFNYFEGE